MITVNEELLNFLLKHPHYIQRFENGTIVNLIEHYSTAKTDIMAKIARLEDYGQGYTLQYRLNRLNDQLREIDLVMKSATDAAVSDLSYTLNEFGRSEKDFYETLLSDKLSTVRINLTRIPVEQVGQIVSTPLGGVVYSDRMYKHYGDNVFLMRNELTQSILQGEDMAKASRRLLGVGKNIGGKVGNEIIKQSTVIARTEIQRVSNSVAKEIYDNNTDVIKGLEYIATLDDRTCLVCGNTDGKVFYYSKNPPTATETPPRHPYCRCVFAPVTKSWKELGIKVEEVEQGTRASFSGQVPATMTYNDWLKQMNQVDPAFVRDILGLKRYELWNSGELTLKQMVRDNRILSLKELKKVKN